MVISHICGKDNIKLSKNLVLDQTNWNSISFEVSGIMRYKKKRLHLSNFKGSIGMIQLAMCIDDDPIVLMLNDLILREQSFCHTLIKVDKAETALQYFEDQSKLPPDEQSLPSLIFLDINMPVMDGWEFLDAFTKRHQVFHHQIKVIILSSSVNPADLEMADNHPLVIGFMPKPLGENELNNLRKHPTLFQYFS